MATVTGGEDFSATPTGVTGARLDNHVNGATISNVAQADMASSTGTIVRSASAPSDTDAGWWDTANNVLRIHDGSSWLPVATGALLTNKSGGSVVAGDLIVADSANDNSFTTSTTQADAGVLGVVAETIAADASGVILYGGIQSVLITGTVNRGEFLRHSTTAKKADSTTTKESGSFGIALETGTNTTIQALITGTVTSLSASTAESITGDWVFSGDPNFTGTPTFSNLATQAQMEAATATNVPVSPATTHNHPGVAKAWVSFDGTAATPITAGDSYNISGTIAKAATAVYTVNWDTDFSSANYAVIITAGDTANTFGYTAEIDTKTASQLVFTLRRGDNNTATEATIVSVVAFGDQ